MAALDLFVVDENEIQQEVTEYIEENIDETLYPGDERKIFTEVLLAWTVQFLVKLNEKFNQRFAQYASGEILDAHGENEDCERLEKTSATSVEQFNIAVALPFNVVVPKGTRVTGDNEKYFATDSIAVIYAGSTSVTVGITAVEGGSSYNGYSVGQLNKLVDKVEYISTVSNTTVTSGGDNGEPYPEEDGGAGDEHYYERIKLSKATKSTAGADNTYIYYAKTADPSITDVYPSSPSAGKVNLAIACANGVVPSQAILNKVLAVCSAKEVRPLGDDLSVSAITQIPYDIELTYYTTTVEETATVAEVEGENGAIARYNEWQVDSITKDINPDRLRAEILKSDTKTVGADRVTITKPVYTQLSAGQIAKFSGNITVNHVLTDGN